MIKKRWSFGLGTIFSLIVVYFIYLYSREKGWALLTFISKWYLIIVGSLIALSFFIIFLILFFSLLTLLAALMKIRKLDKVHKKHKKNKDYVDVEYKVRE